MRQTLPNRKLCFMPLGDYKDGFMSKYTIEIKNDESSDWRQYGEYDSYFSAWRKDKYEKFWFYLNRLFGFSKSRHIETRIVKLPEEK